MLWRGGAASELKSKREWCERGAQLKKVEKELVSLYESCKESGFSRKEMKVICSPLQSALRRETLKRLAIITIAVVLANFLAYQVLKVGFIYTHAMALTRILMIKILPVWDWRHSYYDNCLIQNPLYEDFRPGASEDDCTSCETVEGVDHVWDVDYEFLLGNYLSRDAPFVVTDALEKWSTWSELEGQRFSFENITELYTEDERLVETDPCVLVSNLKTGRLDLMALFKRILNPNVGKWFAHWQNCDILAVKALRKLYQKPYFLPNTVAPAHFNWVLVSSGYSSPIFKKIEPDTGLVMLTQLKGSTVFKLSPLNPCNSTCGEIFGDLLAGEMLIFTNNLWSLEYYPGSDMENVAILTETVWDERVTSF